MKSTFNVKTKNCETTVSVDVKINTSKYILTRYEVKLFKNKLQNKIHNVLREVGYDVNEIRIL